MMTIVLENLVPLLFLVLTPVVLVLVRGVLRAIAKKWHLESVLQYEEKVEELVLTGIQAAEKKSMTAIKKGGSDAKTPGEEKLAMVLDYVNTTLRANGLPEKGGQQLATIVESKLFGGAKLPADPVALSEIKGA
jgi:hypothetical protein